MKWHITRDAKVYKLSLQNIFLCGRQYYYCREISSGSCLGRIASIVSRSDQFLMQRLTQFLASYPD